MAITSARITVVLLPTTVLLLSGLGFARILEVPRDYPTINFALSASEDNDTILVDRGTYHEQLLLPGACGQSPVRTL